MNKEKDDKMANHESNDEWIQNRVQYIRGLKSPSKAQQLLVLLIEKEPITPEDEKKIKTIIKAEKARDRARDAEKGVAQILNAEKRAARKARNHRLIELGALVEIVLGEDPDKNEVVGMLLYALKNAQNSDQRAEMRKNGQNFMSDRKGSQNAK